MRTEKITKIVPSQIGTRIEFTDGFCTEATVEMDTKNNTVTLGSKTYRVGDSVEITKWHEKAVYALE